MPKELNKILSESAGLSVETQEQINEAWESKLSEAKEQLTAQLREEFARKYEHDKGVLAEAMDQFLTDKIRVELEEFAEDKRQLVSERIAYKSKMKEHTSVLNKFITEQVAKEVKELHTDKANMKENFKKLENFLLKQLAEEIREFRKDKRELVEQKVKMVSEGKKHLAETKKQFISRASKIVEANINTVLRAEIGQFKDDIKLARENEFGRRIYEAFVGEYLTSYLNEGTEVSKLQQVLSQKDAEIEAIKEAARQKEMIAEGLQSKLNIANDRISRNKVMSELMSPLAKEKRGVMKDLLESVRTQDLEKAFNKYLPAVLNETAVRKKGPTTLNEGRRLSERTGNRAPNKALQENADNEFNSELESLKTLAGLK
jgi:hypothetical protein